MWKGFNCRSMYRKIGIKNVSKIDSICLGSQTQQIGASIEAPRETSLNYIESNFILSEKDLFSNTAIYIAVCDSHSFGPMPFYSNYLNCRTVTSNSRYTCTYCYILKMRHIYLSLFRRY